MTRDEKSAKYTDLDTIYAQCSGPGGLRLAEFMADAMGLHAGARLLDVGCNRGYQTCFLAKEYGVQAVGIDPWDDRMDGDPMIEHLRRNAEAWGVAERVLGQKIGVPETRFASSTFDFAYSTTALEMIRALSGEAGYLDALGEILRVLKPGGVFGLAEPMHLDVPVPPDLDPYVSREPFPWKACFRDLAHTTAAVRAAGFEILEAAYAPDAWSWWMEFAHHDPFSKADPEQDLKILEIDGGRWTSFGYVVARRPR